MKILLLDVGNSRIKFGFNEEGSFSRFGILESTEKLESYLEVCDLVFVSSVRKGWKLPRKHPNVFTIGFRNSLVKLNYASTLGADRIAKAHYVKYLVRKPSLVLDLGTATVLDYVHESFEGGVILPGIGVWMESLHRSASQLPMVEVEPSIPCYLPKDTKQAILCGMKLSLLNLLKFYEKHLTHEARFITGGYAELVADWFPEYVHERWMVIKGLYEWGIRYAGIL